MNAKNELASTIDDPEFDSLLRRVAQVSGTEGIVTFRPGQLLHGGRFRVVRSIGEGGMGVVYEAYDEQRRGLVALKSLRHLDANAVYRLKHEFRLVAEVLHANLCRLHELFFDGAWFFTMELVRGEPFDQWVRPNGEHDEARLRDAWAQLICGVQAIHDAGRIHRDLKPSNVLVTERGRVVILDFGLAVEEAPGGVGRTLTEDRRSGTPAYMAPEQIAEAEASPACDAYALGVMLFEALCGECPFVGRIGEIFAAKQRDAAPSISSATPHVPADLAQACDALLQRDPALRPTLKNLLGQTSPRPSSSSLEEQPRSESVLIGRDQELQLLRDAYATTLEQRAVVAIVSGESGMGKTALVEHFLDELRGQGDAVLLTGRCYEWEAVPFKAFDAVVDDLSRFLRRSSKEQVNALLPREVYTLTRLFPVLDRVNAVRDFPKREIPDVQELQERAFAAFIELMGRLRDRRPLVIHIDDLQWTDLDSTRFMEALFTHPHPAPLLFIVSHRSEGASESPLLQRVETMWATPLRFECRRVAVGPLAHEAASQLAERMLGGAVTDVGAIARESQGSPFFLGALTRQLRDTTASAGCFTLQQAVTGHITRLAVGSRCLLEVLAVAGRPLNLQWALDAAEVNVSSADELLAERLARSSGGEGRRIECYHDKIREHVFASLGAAPLRDVHNRLAERLSRESQLPFEHRAVHFQGAGRLHEAALLYESAGEVATAALAFDHAVRQYEHALMLAPTTAHSALRAKLGAALASAGSSRAAADVLRAAAADAPPELALEYVRTAAHLLTTSGYLDEGRVLLGEVLSAIGLSLPQSRRAAITSALFSHARLHLRGLRPVQSGREKPVPTANLRALWTVVQGSLGNDPFLMVEMAARYTRLALDSGDKLHMARALSMQACLGSFAGPRTHARSTQLLGRAQKLADEVGETALGAWMNEVKGLVLVHEGRFAEARPVLQDALEVFQTRCHGVPFELACGRGYDLNAGNHLGHYAQVSRAAVEIVDNSLRRGDMYQATGVASFAMCSWLAHHGLDFAERHFDEAKQRFLPQAHFQWADYLMLMGDLHLAQYQGQAARGLQLVVDRWPVMESSQLLRMEIARVMMLYCRAACSLDATNVSEPAFLNAGIRGLKRSPLAYARNGWACVLEANVAWRKGRTEAVVARLQAAIETFDESAFEMYGAAARRRLGQILGGERGRATLTQGEAAMTLQGVVDFEATTRMLVPGLS